MPRKNYEAWCFSPKIKPHHWNTMKRAFSGWRRARENIFPHVIFHERCLFSLRQRKAANAWRREMWWEDFSTTKITWHWIYVHPSSCIEFSYFISQENLGKWKNYLSSHLEDESNSFDVFLPFLQFLNHFQYSFSAWIHETLFEALISNDAAP